MIKLSERFSVDSDKYNWILHEYYLGKDKDGKPKTQSRVTFHATLEQVAKKIVEQSAKERESLERMLKVMRNAVYSVEDFLNEKVKK